MRRGEVCWTTFDDAVGGEIRKRRPAIIISNDVSNAILNRVQIIPLTGNSDRLYPGEAIVTLNGRRSKALATQIATVDKERVLGLAGVVSADELVAVEHALKTQLGLR